MTSRTAILLAVSLLVGCRVKPKPGKLDASPPTQGSAFAPSGSLTEDSDPALRGTPKVSAEIRRRARRFGVIRVIVVMRQQGSLQNDLLVLRSRLEKSPGYRSFNQLGRLPLVAIAADAVTLGILDSAPEVAQVALDTAAPPAALSTTVKSIHADELWSRNLEGVGATVAILDTGIDATHPFLKTRVVEQACFSIADDNHISLCPNGANEDLSASSATPSDIAVAKHGTHVAGIAAGLDGDCGEACLLQGVARKTQIVAVQIFTRPSGGDGCGGADVCTYASSQMAALDYLDQHHVRLNLAAANLSISEDTQLSHVDACDDDLRKGPIDTLLGDGVATVIAAGNQIQMYGVSRPGCISSAFTVGGLSAGNYPILSAGRMVDLFAPGSCVVSSVPGLGYESGNGTSVAAPLVAGAIAALRSTPNPRPLAAILEALVRGGSDVKDCRSDEDKKGLDLHGALQVLQSTNGTRVPVGGGPLAPGSSGRPPTTGGGLSGGDGTQPPVGGALLPPPRSPLNDCRVNPPTDCPAVCEPAPASAAL